MWSALPPYLGGKRRLCPLIFREIDRVIPKEGAWPPPDKQLVLELNSLAWLGAELGDTIFAETAEGKIRPMEIVGEGRYQSGPPVSMSGTPTGPMPMPG